MKSLLINSSGMDFGRAIGIGLAAFLLAALWVNSAARAAEAGNPYPARPVRVVVPLPPGGGSDLLARIVSPQLAERFAQPFVVDNRAGAGGTMGSELVARAAPDGYTLIVAYTASHGINPAVKKLPYDAVNDFAPVTMLSTAPNVLVVHPSVPAKSVKELIQWYALLAPARTPAAIIMRLNGEVARILKVQDVRDKLAAQGMDPGTSTPGEVTVYIRDEIAKWSRLIKETGLKLE